MVIKVLVELVEWRDGRKKLESRECMECIQYSQHALPSLCQGIVERKAIEHIKYK